MTTGIGLHHPATWKAILSGGFVAGTIGIGAVCLIAGLDPAWIAKLGAVALFYPSAFRGDTGLAVLAMLLLQWGMSLLIAAVFVVAARDVPAMRRFWVGCGLAYGAFAYFVMNNGVVPLLDMAHLKFMHFTLGLFCKNMLAMLLFGLIVAGFARHFLGRDAAA